MKQETARPEADSLRLLPSGPDRVGDSFVQAVSRGRYRPGRAGKRVPGTTKGRLLGRRPFHCRLRHWTAKRVLAANLLRGRDPAPQLVTMRHWITSFRILLPPEFKQRGAV